MTGQRPGFDAAVEAGGWQVGIIAAAYPIIVSAVLAEAERRVRSVTVHIDDKDGRRVREYAARNVAALRAELTS